MRRSGSGLFITGKEAKREGRRPEPSNAYGLSAAYQQTYAVFRGWNDN